MIPGVVNFFEGVIHKANIRFQGLGILPKMLMHYLRILVGACIFLPLTFALIKVKFKKSLLVLIGIALSYVTFVKYGVTLSIVIGGAISLLLFAFYLRKRTLAIHEWILGLGAFMVLIAFAFGTFSEGLQFYKYGLWLLIPLSFLIKVPKENQWLSNGRQILTISIVILFVVTRITWPTFPYLERSILSMTAPFQTPLLKGIFTYPEKEKSLDSVFAELQKLNVTGFDI